MTYTLKIKHVFQALTIDRTTALLVFRPTSCSILDKATITYKYDFFLKNQP